MSADRSQIEVRPQPERSRYEALVDGEHAGYAVYRDRDDVRVFTHTEVDDAFGGRGVGGRLVQAALDATRTEGLTVVPQCSFVDHFIAQHPGYQDLLAGR